MWRFSGNQQTGTRLAISFYENYMIYQNFWNNLHTKSRVQSRDCQKSKWHHVGEINWQLGPLRSRSKTTLPNATQLRDTAKISSHENANHTRVRDKIRKLRNANPRREAAFPTTRITHRAFRS